ncbi:DUF817 domain-containing protein [Roseomonas fluvialis]|uniref:Membrane protein n=1 Tax=Roseomonas fluvialis TaxID=1750527 RepID=A0ABM7Y0M6_9PROT|nr:DUF817 domain-containing protein [Roseomonas fluvialis]BDG71325.1 membrane protein [Roseomonas fluvialis]
MTDSAASAWPPIARFIAAERRLSARAVRAGPVAAGFYEFLRFGAKQGWACLFGGALLALLVATHLFYPRESWLPRYDFLLVACIGIQAALLALRMETLDEARVILVFHVVGTAMEVFKTAVGSWSYPEFSYLRIGGVPLFTGFMYAAVGSYVARAWRLFDFRFTRHPPAWAVLVLGAAIYVNFFTHHYTWDARWVLFAAAGVMFGRCRIWFRPWRRYRWMPLLVGFGLVALFIWFAENLGTFAGVWLYPHQRGGWSMVPPAKFGAWFLLMLLSYALVFALHEGRGAVRAPPPRAKMAFPSARASATVR